MKRRIMCLLLTLLFLTTLLPLPQAEAAHLRVSLSDLREKFPNGTYWNHHSGYNNPNGYSTTPCGHSHGNCDYYGGCGCNSFDNAIQCMGYSYKLGYDYYGTSVKTWPKAYSLADLKPGDVVRINGDRHSLFVTAVTDTTVTYTDCNMDKHCGIRWDVVVSRSYLASLLTYVSVAPYAAVEGFPPTDPGFQNTQNVYRQYETVNLRWNEIEDNESYRLTISVDGEELFTRNLSTSLAFALRLDRAGSYEAVLSGTNEYGESEQAEYGFTVLPASQPGTVWLTAQEKPLWVQRGLDLLSLDRKLGAPASQTDPALSLNRAALATLLWRSAGQPEMTSTDTNAQWYSGAAAWAQKMGFFDKDAAFDPDASVTREQLAVILYRFASRFASISGTKADLSVYPDAASLSPEAEDAMSWAVAAGLLASTSGGGVVYLAPKDAVTAEDAMFALALLLRPAASMEHIAQHQNLER